MLRFMMTLACRSPSTRTLGNQLVAISIVLALIERMFFMASRPMPIIAASRTATMEMILARIEYLASMAAISGFDGAWRTGVAKVSAGQAKAFRDQDPLRPPSNQQNAPWNYGS